MNARDTAAGVEPVRVIVPRIYSKDFYLQPKHTEKFVLRNVFVLQYLPSPQINFILIF
jgi:hypothetical protein